MEDTDQIICHCVSTDCSNCPMRKTGTSGIKAEQSFLQGNYTTYIAKTLDNGGIEIKYIP